MRRALVTGGSGVIGTAICRDLARAGFDVLVHANSHRAKADALVAEIGVAGGTAESTCFDVTDAAATLHALERLLTRGPIQVVVNNAGIHIDAPLPGMGRDQWTDVIDVTLNGFFNVTQPLLLPMLGTRWGRIINVSSIAAVIGNRGQANYAAAKAGLHGATKALALELASRGVTVNAVAPGVIDSPATAQAFSAERIKSVVPMQRAGVPDDVAALVSFLASERASYITGQIISIAGGLG
jgi:3-oxoacyl-[acyl-carrier protein] reductase